MDNKTTFVKTRKGEDEMRGKTSQLPGDLKRALLMVDGSSTFSEIRRVRYSYYFNDANALFDRIYQGDA